MGIMKTSVPQTKFLKLMTLQIQKHLHHCFPRRLHQVLIQILLRVLIHPQSKQKNT